MKHRAEMERRAQARAKVQSWSNARRGEIWLQLLGLPEFMALQREKRLYLDELMHSK
jgi:hypothetical protein